MITFQKYVQTILLLFLCFVKVNFATGEFYLYDDFEDDEIDTLKWYWRHGIPTPSEVKETDGKLMLELSSDSNPKLYFTYHPDTIEAEVSLLEVSGSGASGGTQIAAVWFFDNDIQQTVVSKIGINYQTGKDIPNFSVYIRSKNSSKDYIHKWRDCTLNTPYKLRMEKRNHSIHFFINDEEWIDAAYHFPSSVVDIDDIILTDKKKEEKCHISDTFGEKYFYFDNFFWEGNNVVVKSTFDNVKTNKQTPPKGKYSVKNSYASFFDTEQRKQLIKETDNEILKSLKNSSSMDCLKVGIPIPVGTNESPIEMPAGYYQDHPDYYNEMRKPLSDFEDAIVNLAASYMCSNTDSCAEYLLDILYYWADNNALLTYCYESDNRSAWYEVNLSSCTVGFVYSIIKNNYSLDITKKQKVEKWLKQVVEKYLYHSGTASDSVNNHLYWRGLGAAIVGVVTNDNDLFDYGVRVYLRALDHMNSDGSFPLEMLRGKCAIHYQNFAIFPLIFIAEISYQQGYDLYAEEADGKNIHLAVDFLFDILEKPQILIQKGYTSITSQDFLEKNAWGKGWNLCWIEPYQKRFQNERFSSYIQNQGIDRKKGMFQNRWTAGCSTLYFYGGSNGYITNGCDVNADDKIGLEEIIYFLQIISGIK
ncbi:MAG: hypothetical protein GY749_23330 [Desulfobacteraceae bacterium]|nr:hypothetical protein [Desulfobacteraceae bacterium]